MNKVLKEEIIYDGKIITVKKETMILPNNKEAVREFVHHKNAVAILGVIDNNVLLVKQFRTGSKSELIEIPAGLIENGEDPEITAIRELQEETGYKPNSLNFLGKFFLSPGFCDETIYLYFSDDLTESKLPQDEDEFIEVIKLPVENIRSFISDTSNTLDIKTILSLSLYLNQTVKN